LLLSIHTAYVSPIQPIFHLYGLLQQYLCRIYWLGSSIPATFNHTCDRIYKLLLIHTSYFGSLPSAFNPYLWWDLPTTLNHTCGSFYELFFPYSLLQSIRATFHPYELRFMHTNYFQSIRSAFQPYDLLLVHTS
jgi:hypothetical protein